MRLKRDRRPARRRADLWLRGECEHGPGARHAEPFDPGDALDEPLEVATGIILVVDDNREGVSGSEREQRRRIAAAQRQRQDRVVRRRVARIAVHDRPPMFDRPVHRRHVHARIVSRQLEDSGVARRQQGPRRWRSQRHRIHRAVEGKSGERRQDYHRESTAGELM